MLLVLPLLSACATTMASVGTESAPGAASFCEIAQPIVWFSTDNPRTILGVKEHNAVGKKLCGWGTSK